MLHVAELGASPGMPACSNCSLNHVAMEPGSKRPRLTPFPAITQLLAAGLRPQGARPPPPAAGGRSGWLELARQLRTHPPRWLQGFTALAASGMNRAGAGQSKPAAAAAPALCVSTPCCTELLACQQRLRLLREHATASHGPGPQRDARSASQGRALHVFSAPCVFLPLPVHQLSTCCHMRAFRRKRA